VARQPTGRSRFQRSSEQWRATSESVSGSCTASQCLAIGGLKSIVSTKDHMDSARAVTGSRSTDDDVVAAVVIQVCQDHGRSKLIARGALAETGILLRQGLARCSSEAEIDLSGVTATAWHTDDQVGSAVAIHITNDWNVGLAIRLGGSRCLHRRQPSDSDSRYQYRGPESAHAALTLEMTSSANLDHEAGNRVCRSGHYLLWTPRAGGSAFAIEASSGATDHPR
jgi:hypothetical protein